MSLPDFNNLPAPLWLITTLHLITFTLHLLAMNFVAGGLLLLVFGGGGSRLRDPGVQRFLKQLPTAMAATVTLGVAPLLFLQLTYPRQVYSSAIVSGWFWLLVPFAVICAYYLLYAASPDKCAISGRQWTRLAFALAGVLYVSLVYSSVFSMAERPQLIRELYSRVQNGWVINPRVADYALRWLHTILGAVGVGGYFITLFARDDRRTAEFGKRGFYWGMGLSAVTGVFYLMSLMGDLARLMRTPAAWSLTLGILLAAGAVAHFAMGKLPLTGVLLGLSVLAMVMNRHWLRTIRLDGANDPAALPVVPQWGAFVFFAVCFLLALGAIGWMLRLRFVTGKAE